MQKQYLENQVLTDDCFKTLTEIANENGFLASSHQVVTKDGYILSLWRIPGSMKESQLNSATKPPVLMVPALEVDMMEWVVARPEVAHAFVLARQGYDVWLLNNRGTRFSQAHVSLDPKSKEFWNFDWEDMGTKDLPATLDYISNATGFEKVNYMGHSQGTTQIIAGSALDSDYFNSKINLAVLMAPPMSLKNCKDEAMVTASNPVILQGITAVLEAAGQYNLIPYGSFSAGVTSGVCKLFDGAVCKFALKWFGGGDPNVDDMTRVPVFMSGLPSGSGYKNFVHYGQLMHTDTESFRRYDHGAIENHKRYGQSTPPDYELAKIKYPIAMLAGTKDVLADPADVAWFHEQMKDTTVFFKGDYDLDHNSFAIAKDMSFFTKDAMAVLNHYNDKCDESTAGSSFVEGNDKCAREQGFM